MADLSTTTVTATPVRPAIVAVVAVPPVAAAAARLAEAGLAAPDRPACRRTGDLLVIGKAPGAWTVVAEGPEPRALEARLAGIVGSEALVADQSDAWTVFRLAGPAVRDLLMRGVGIDVDRSVFGPGASATTPIAGIDALIWTEDGAAIHVAVPASTEQSFLDWLAETVPGLDG